MDAFIELPGRLMADDANYVAPLKLERRQSLSAKTNPFFNYADVAFWLAFEDGKPVGRISAQDDRRIPGIGHFGMVMAKDDPAVFAALFDEAEAWLGERGLARVQGPFDLSINEEIGTLVDGFDTPPMLMMGHNPRYTGARIEEQGYGRLKDVHAYLYNADEHTPKWIERVQKRPPPKNVKLRSLDQKNYDRDLASIVDIFNDAWSGNWGFIPFAKDEMEALAKAMKPLLEADMVPIVEVDGEPVGFGVCLPNLNEATRDLRGRIAPFGWTKLLWRLKVSGVATGRVPLMGFRKKISETALGSLLPFLVMNQIREQAMKRGIRRIEMSWVLEDNMPMRHLGESLSGGKPYKTYRLYKKTLA
ncbi:dATP pyrophosphohydrolase [Pararhizobium mangrovi]|uniref:dATP pyrophosphohydrolase n=2 Tax=Pararhizobium mangrovi TaxID=2590452 RepID=A0A506UDZ0_9HYPH|nr:dATP pyrophosphohydrolase [Pararhizobium mangrovi]